MQIDIYWPVRGISIARHHEHAVYAALSQRSGLFHTCPEIGIAPITGETRRSRLLLQPDSHLRVRAPEELAPELVVSCRSACLQILQDRIVLGKPSIRRLRPVADLEAIVNIRLQQPNRKSLGLGKHLPARCYTISAFREALIQQLFLLGIEWRDLQISDRQRWHIEQTPVITYRVCLRGLSPAHSLLLQERGIGGRRKFGCGIFVPISNSFLQIPQPITSGRGVPATRYCG